MKLTVDLTSPMPGRINQHGKVVTLAFVCTMMSNLMPSLASMDNKSLLANITALYILVITVIVNSFIQIRTHVIGPYPDSVGVDIPPMLLVVVACIYLVMLLFLLIILISSAITIPNHKENFRNKVSSH
ncbi:hypothetical protein Hanom_Chr06g00508931 [Helianthus anomalus]